MKKYIKINEKEISFSKMNKKINQKDFEESLMSQIKKDLSRYKMYINDINISLTGEEYIDMMQGRTLLEEEIIKLNKNKNIKYFQKTLDELDQQFKAQKDTLIKKFGDLTELSSAPKKQWWNHLKTYNSK
ncbi:MAG: hypothetical protein WC108_04530 [Bacteroidales bacterium]